MPGDLEDRLLSAWRDAGVAWRGDVPLGPMTWYGVGGACRWLIEPTDETQLTAALAAMREAGVAWRVLGGGANLLVREGGVEEAVIRLAERGVFGAWDVEVGEGDRDVAMGEGRVCVSVGGAVDLFKLVQHAARMGWSGLECLAGVPGTVGGAVRMNAGGAFGSIGERVAWVRLVDATTGGVVERAGGEMGFDYRRSAVGPEEIVTGASLLLERGDPAAVRAKVKEVFAAKKASQPMGEHSSGCAFKNPRSNEGSGAARRSAGALIDQCGLKGYRVGRASVSPVHANFVVLDRGGDGRPLADARADDVIAVIEHVERVVAARTGVRLEREVVVWP